MKKLSLILAATVLFGGLSFASHIVKQDAKAPVAKQTAKPAVKSTKAKPATTKTAPKATNAAKPAHTAKGAPVKATTK
jgi:hypothetical protein